MAETQRTVAEILALLADNTTQAISPQDERDAFVTGRSGYGQIYVPATDAAAVSIGDTTNYFEATTTPAWTLSANPYFFDESAGNGRLTYIGVADVICVATLTVSLTVSGTNQLIHFRLGKSGTDDLASEIIRYVTIGTDVGAASTQVMTPLSTGQYISAWFRNETSTGNVTIEAANLKAITLPS
jgi:hypothetical protein